MVVAVLVPFLSALTLSLLLTPFVGRLARRRGLVDLPSRRKVHSRPVPRVGGIAIFAAFVLTFGISYLVPALRGEPALAGRQFAGLLAGGALIFALGLLDDFLGLSPGLKILVQALVGLIAYSCGLGFHSLQLPGTSIIQLGILSIPVTILWYVLVINAFNLIDGLDGLAAGIAVFSCLILLVLGLLRSGIIACVGLAALAGASLGFLRYNFNPATIFMGDGGSYFIGFTLAALSILGSLKTQASVTILIPIIALGLPLMEVIWSGLRRFLMGQALFGADKDHLHHRLLRLGYTHRKAVLVLYGLALTLGLTALILVDANDRVASIVLVAIGLVAVVIIRRLGYIDYLTTEKFIGWTRDFSAVMGVTGGGRTFLGLQVVLSESGSLDELWQHLQGAARHLRMDRVELELGEAFTRTRYGADLTGPTGPAAARPFDPLTTLRISMPVGDADHRLGFLVLTQRVGQAAPEYHVLRRMEHLRRSVSTVLLRLHAGGPTVGMGTPAPADPRAARQPVPPDEVEAAIFVSSPTQTVGSAPASPESAAAP